MSKGRSSGRKVEEGGRGPVLVSKKLVDQEKLNNILSVVYHDVRIESVRATELMRGIEQVSPRPIYPALVRELDFSNAVFQESVRRWREVFVELKEAKDNEVDSARADYLEETGAENEVGTLRCQNNELELENERLNSRVAELKWSRNREIQRYDQECARFKGLLAQEAARFDGLLATYSERCRANDVALAVVAGREGGRLRMFETYEGVIKHADDETVIALFEIDDELIEQTYKKEQFIDLKLPAVGDNIAVYVHVAQIPESGNKEPGNQSESKGSNGQPENPREYHIGPLDI